MTESRNRAPGAARLATLSCSFCNKDKDAIAKLVAGPGVYICNECVELCNLIIAEEPAQPGHQLDQDRSRARRVQAGGV